ncbi:High-affinity nicotinic acid transporter [Ciborinia camelliae]|nr:High-affinity nicotinic acid transporter [Ciborinia camelliae]
MSSLASRDNPTHILASHHLEQRHSIARQKSGEDVIQDSLSDDALSSPAQYSTINEKALVRKIDRRLLPMLFIIYLAAFLDRIWYKREESLQRFTVYWCSVLTASAFGGLLASAIQKMDGLRGLHNWQWIFILEGVLTVLIGFSAFFLVTDFPEDAKWLTEEERRFVIDRVGGIDKDQTITTGDILKFFKSLKNVLGGVMYFCVVVPIYSFAYFTPTIIKTYGYSVVQTQLHTVPPFAAALVLCLITAYASDRLKLRWPFIAFGLSLAIVGLAILMTVHHSFSAEYAGICLVAMGVFTAGIAVVCWYVMNLQGHVERAIGTAWMIGFGNSGGIVATFAFLATDAPFYHTGYSICIGAMCICAGACILYGLLSVYHNRKLRANGAKETTLYSL